MNPTSMTQNLGTKFWNVVDNVTIGLTQIKATKAILTVEVKFFLPLNIGQHNKILGRTTRPDRHTMQQWTMHSFERLKRSGMTHESGSSRISTEYPIDCNDMQTSAMFKGNDKLLPFISKNDSFPIFPIMGDECLF